MVVHSLIGSKDNLQKHLGLGLHPSCTDKSLARVSSIMSQGVLSLTGMGSGRRFCFYIQSSERIPEGSGGGQAGCVA